MPSLQPADEVGQTSVLLQEQILVAASLLRALSVQVEQARGLLDDLETRRRTLGSVDEQVTLLEDRAESLTRLVESAEINVAVLSHSTAKRLK